MAAEIKRHRIRNEITPIDVTLCTSGRSRPRSHRRYRRAPSMPRATTSPTAGVSPLQSSTPSIDEPVVPVQPRPDAVHSSPPPPAPVRKPPNALNLSEPRRGRRKKSVIDHVTHGAGPAVTFPAARHYRLSAGAKLYYMVCELFARDCCLKAKQPGLEHATY